MSIPPELRVLCRRLTSTSVEDLPRLCPTLVGYVLRCGGPLSAVPETKGKDNASEASVLVHRLRTHINTLLNGRSPAGRSAAICLIKAVIDVGGWESLRQSESWIRGLISILQKPDPIAAKELCIVSLTKIYMTLQGYQTLVRETATPTLPSYVTACLQLIKSPASDKALKTPLSLVNTVAWSLSKIIPLFPTTLRPFSAQITAELKTYVAPTSSDPLSVPEGLRESARKALIVLHYTAPKNGSSDEWAKSVRATVNDCHKTADQIFRAVQESWESTSGYRSQAARTDVEPSGGTDASDGFPTWTGLTSGAERLVGLLEFLAAYFQMPTKAAVTLPLGDVLDLTGRISLITLPTSEDSAGMNAAISRDERAELWSVLPDIHAAALRLHTAIYRRLQSNAISLSTDSIDQMVRIFGSDRHVPSVRESAYDLANELLLVAGPTLPKLTVDSLVPLIQACCRDTLRPTGYEESRSEAPPNGAKQKDPASSNADAFLATSTTTNAASSAPRASHEEAALSLLPMLLSHLPQRHLSPDSRALLDRTAILAASKPAMLASCLHPYKDSRGRYYPSILPFLVRQFPQDQDVEVLRTNLLRSARAGTASHVAEQTWDDPREGLDVLLQERKDDESEPVDDGDVDMNRNEATEKEVKPSSAGWGLTENKTEVDTEPVVKNAFFTAERTVVVATNSSPDNAGDKVPTSPLKRKASEIDPGKAKRVDTGKGPETVVDVSVTAKAVDDEGSDSDSDAESIQIDMTMDDDDEEDEADEE